MSFLVDLPHKVSVDVLSKWTELGDLMLLDSAVCNEKERTQLLRLFSYPSFTVQNYVFINTNCDITGCLPYISLRRLKLLELSMECSNVAKFNCLTFDKSLISDISVKDSDYITGEESYNIWLEQLVMLVNACFNLKQLTFSSLIVSRGKLRTFFDPNVIKHLVTIEVIWCSPVLLEIVEHLVCEHCNNLKSVHFEYKYQDGAVKKRSYSMTKLHKIIKRNPNIHSIKLVVEHCIVDADKLLDILCNETPSLTSLDLEIQTNKPHLNWLTRLFSVHHTQLIKCNVIKNDQGFEYFSVNRNFSCLTHWVSGEMPFTDLFSFYPNLTDIDLHGDGVTAEILQSIASNCRKLRIFELKVDTAQVEVL